MASYSDRFAKTRERNAAAFSAFGVDLVSPTLEIVAKGSGPDVYTIGYERRDGDDLVAALRDAGVTALVDVRQRAMSRRADFRGGPLAARCEDAGIEYIAMPELGSTDELRDRLRESNDFDAFAKAYALLAKASMQEPLEELADLAASETIALLCYERCHNECHRSVLADFLHQSSDAQIIAIK